MVIGVMDSGIGGITTLAKLMEVCGGNYVYVRDERGPYGDKDAAFVLNRTAAACDCLKSRGAKIIVLACNTATNVAISYMRRLDKDTRYLGVEPAVKPALKMCDRVCVALTPTASKQEKFIRLIGQDRGRIKLIALSNLATQIERAYSDKSEIMRLSRMLISECDGDGLVLGCTHYVFLRDSLSELNPTLKIFDGNDGVARRLSNLTGYMGAPTVEFLKIR